MTTAVINMFISLMNQALRDYETLEVQDIQRAYLFVFIDYLTSGGLVTVLIKQTLTKLLIDYVYNM